MVWTEYCGSDTTQLGAAKYSYDDEEDCPFFQSDDSTSKFTPYPKVKDPSSPSLVLQHSNLPLHPRYTDGEKPDTCTPRWDLRRRCSRTNLKRTVRKCCAPAAVRSGFTQISLSRNLVNWTANPKNSLELSCNRYVFSCIVSLNPPKLFSPSKLKTGIAAAARVYAVTRSCA